jgi:hypothetical protein
MGRFTLLEKWGYTWIVPGDTRKYVDLEALRARGDDNDFPEAQRPAPTACYQSA